MAITVTATQGGSTANGILLRVFVLTGAAAAGSQTGGSANQQLANTLNFTQSITAASTGSNIYGTCSRSQQGEASTASNCTIVDDFSDTVNAERLVTWHALNVSSGAVVRGHTISPSSASGPMAQLEILASGTLAEDSSGPAVATATGATTVTTASFTPPGGSLLVALVASDGGVSVTTMTVSDSSTLSWSEKVKNNPSGGDYAGIWIAQVAGGSSAPNGTAPDPAAVPVCRRAGARARLGAAALAGAGVAGPGNAAAVIGTPQPPQYLILGRSSRLVETYRLVI